MTLLAAQNLGRQGFGFEIKREFVDGFERSIRGAGETQIDLWGPQHHYGDTVYLRPGGTLAAHDTGTPF